MMKIKRILLSRTDNIGDVVLTIPMAGAIKSMNSDIEVWFLGKSYTRPIIELSSHIDNFLNWDDIVNENFNSQVNFFKKANIDVFIHVFPDKKIAQIVKSAKIPIRVGTSHRLFHLLTCNRLIGFSRKNSNLHEAQLNMKLLKPFFKNKEYKKTEYSLSEISKLYGINKNFDLPDRINKLIAKNKFNLIFHPKSSGSAREWGLDNFEKLYESLPKDKFKVFITGTRNEHRLLANFIKKHPKIIDLCGKLSLEELIAFISKSNGIVAASTGPLHLAAALGTHALGIYAPMRPIHPGRWAPIGNNAYYFVVQKKCNDCQKSMDCHCIREIAPESILAKLMEIEENMNYEL